jgi:hypothetical protein
MKYANEIESIETGLKKGQKGLHIEVSDMTYESIDLIYDADYILQRVTLNQHGTSTEKGNKLHVIYSEIDAKSTVSNTQFDTKSIVREKDGTLVPAPKYATYRVVDQRRGAQ